MISRRTASSKDEVKRIACLVSGRGLGMGEVKRVGKKADVGEVEVAKYEDAVSHRQEISLSSWNSPRAPGG